jgi:CRISPR system Cascade subunit CasA
MPRRLRLVFSAGPLICALTGEPVETAVTGVVQRPHGVKYGIWKHPLTPYWRRKLESEPYSMKPKAGRIAPGDWVAAVVGDPGGLHLPAETVRRARGERRREIGVDARLLAAGWVMNNMEAVEYLFAETPLHVAADEAVREELDGFAKRAAEAADAAHEMLRKALATALFPEERFKGNKIAAAGRKGLFSSARSGFFDRIEGAFHQLLAGIALARDQDEALDRGDAANEAWRQYLERAALDVFDTHAPILLHDAARSARIVRARGALRGALHGWGPKGRKLFDALGLQSPERKKDTA